MALTLQNRQVGQVTIVKCAGRIVEGADGAALEQHVGGLLPHQRFLILDLSEVTFLDSSGLGLLVRLLASSKRAGGDLKLCALTPRIREVLRLTRLQATLDSRETETEAVAAFYEREAPDRALDFHTDILCADTSADVVAYVAALLRQAGYGVATANNVYDALILLKATRPKAVVAGATLRAAGTHSAEEFNQRAGAKTLIELPPEFSGDDAGEAGARLLDLIRSAVGEPTRR